jgi:hypothetical protein
MPEPNRIVIDKVEWKSVLPVLRLVSAFRHALQPGKLLVALVAVIAIHISGITFNALLGVNESNDGPGDLTAYDMLVQGQSAALYRMVTSAVDLDHGFGASSQGVTDALYHMVIGIPIDMFQSFPWFTVLFGIDVLFVLAMACGVLTRMSASQVCANRNTGMGMAASFVSRRWARYLMTPLMPAALIGVFALLLFIAGVVFFNVAVLGVVGSIVYGLMLVLGVLIGLLVILLALGLFLIPPALSVEGSDGFDAISRAFNYILFRPWQFAGYLLASMLYLAVVFVLLSAIMSAGVSATDYFVDAGSFIQAQEGSPPAANYEEVRRILEDPSYEGTESDAAYVSGWIMARWMEILAIVVLAIMLSTFCCLQTQAYVLMRRSADGTPMDQYDGEAPGELWADAAAQPVAQDESKETEGEANGVNDS